MHDFDGGLGQDTGCCDLSVVGRDHYGVFPLRGKCKNVRDASVSALTANKEFADLKKILGLQQGKVYKSVNDLRDGRVMIMTDADADGSHIKGLILNMIHAFWPSLLDIGFIVSLVTPVIKASRAGKSVEFYTDAAFRSWYAQQQNQTSWRIKYYKGLGTSTSAEAREYFKAIDTLTVRFVVDERADKRSCSRSTKARQMTGRWTSRHAGTRSAVRGDSIAQRLRFVHKDLVNILRGDCVVDRVVVDRFKPFPAKVCACWKILR